MLRMTINIEPEERDALVKLAHQEKRDFRQQAALLICERLRQLKLLPAPTTTKQEATDGLQNQHD